MTRAQQHPAGLTAMGTTVLVWIMSSLGVSLPPEVAASIVGLTAAVVSWRTPRT